MNGQLKNRKLPSFCSNLYLGLSEKGQALSCKFNLCLIGWCRQLAIQAFEHTPAHTTTKFLARHKQIAIISQKRKRLTVCDLLWTSDKGAVLTGEHPLSMAIWVVSSHTGQVSSVESAQFTVKQDVVRRGFLSVRFGCITSLCNGVEVVQLPLHIWGLRVKRFCQENTTNHNLCSDTTNAKVEFKMHLKCYMRRINWDDNLPSVIWTSSLCSGGVLGFSAELGSSFWALWTLSLLSVLARSFMTSGIQEQSAHRMIDRDKLKKKNASNQHDQNYKEGFWQWLWFETPSLGYLSYFRNRMHAW